MRVCLISLEIFAWGKYGGFGRATRMIGRELVRCGVEVFAVVPRRRGQRPKENLDGIHVLSFQPGLILSSRKLYRLADADVYHSMEPSLGTYLARKTMPHRKHAITFRDPRNWRDWYIEFKFPSLSRARVILNWLYEDSLLVKRAVRKADGLYMGAHFMASKVKNKYRLSFDPQFLPTPVAIPEKIQKSSIPTVCFVGRMDRRKRPEIFFKLAKLFPHVRFQVVGMSQDFEWEKSLRKLYGDLPNLEMLGFINQFESQRHSHVLEQSWIMVNTSARESLPNVFLEAAAHRCAILSSVDPDGFSSRFGYHASQDDFASGLEWLLEENRWQEQGMLGYEYVREAYAVDKAIDQHLEFYKMLISS